MPNDLYVMQNNRILDEVKIGRFIDPEKRRRRLQTSRNYSINSLAIFLSAGTMEGVVHDILAYCREQDVPGREWFRCSTQAAFCAIGGALARKSGVN